MKSEDQNLYCYYISNNTCVKLGKYKYIPKEIKNGIINYQKFKRKDAAGNIISSLLMMTESQESLKMYSMGFYDSSIHIIDWKVCSNIFQKGKNLYYIGKNEKEKLFLYKYDHKDYTEKKVTSLKKIKGNKELLMIKNIKKNKIIIIKEDNKINIKLHEKS
jgi:hypothetical protein